jgi:putative inorganic carbon (HCO3(-)) transporter
VSVEAARRDRADDVPLFGIAFTAGALATAGLCVLAVTRPATALLLFIATATLLICFWRVEIALLLLVATGPLEAAYHPSSSLTLTKVAGLLAFASFGFHALITRRRLMFDGMHALVFLLLALSFLSTANAHDGPTAVTTVVRYASFVVMFFVISQFGSDHALLRRIAWVLTLASAVASYIALANLFSGRSIFAGLPYANENDVAFTLATTLPFALWVAREPGLRRIVALASAGTIAAAIVLTFSRGAFLGLAAAAIWKLFADRRNLGGIVVGVIAAAAITIVLIQVNPTQVHNASIAKQKSAQENVITRLAAWSGAARLAEEHPFVGVGPGNFQSYFYDVTGRPPGTEKLVQVHNTYLDIAAEVGPIGLILFVAFLAVAFLRTARAARESLGPPGLAPAVLTSLIVAAVSGSFLSEQYSAPFWLLGALTSALWSERAREPATAP